MLIGILGFNNRILYLLKKRNLNYVLYNLFEGVLDGKKYIFDGFLAKNTTVLAEFVSATLATLHNYSDIFVLTQHPCASILQMPVRRGSYRNTFNV